MAKHLETRLVFLLATDPTGSAITTGDGKAYFRVPAELNGFDLVRVAAAVSTQSSSGVVNAMLRRFRSGSSADMLSTAITIDASETDTSTAATAAVINTSNDDVATNDLIFVDIDGAGTGAKGLGIEMLFRNP